MHGAREREREKGKQKNGRPVFCCCLPLLSVARPHRHTSPRGECYARVRTRHSPNAFRSHRPFFTRLFGSSVAPRVLCIVFNARTMTICRRIGHTHTLTEEKKLAPANGQAGHDDCATLTVCTSLAILLRARTQKQLGQVSASCTYTHTTQHISVCSR